MNLLLEDGLLVDLLELGLEVLQTCSVAAAVGATASVGKVEAFILHFLTINTPRYMRQSSYRYGAGLTLTSLPCPHRSSWSSSGRRRHGQTWRSNEGDAVRSFVSLRKNNGEE